MAEDIVQLYSNIKIKSIENSDFVCIINPEMKMDTEELYLTFKLLKRRYRSSETNEKLRRLEYFNHPFEANNEIRLIDDIDLPKSLSMESLSTQFKAVDDKKTINATEREVKTSKKSKYVEDSPMDDFEPFDFEQATNYQKVGKKDGK